LSAGAALLAWALSGGPVLPVLGIALGIWLIVGVAADLGARVGAFRLPWPEVRRRAAGLPRATWGMSVAHAGFGITILGIVANTSWTQNWQGLMKPGEQVRLGSYVFRLDGTEQVQGPNYTALRAKIDVRPADANGPAMSLYPEQRSYPVPPMQTTEAAIRPRPAGDLYAVVGPHQDGGYPVRLYIKPLASWIWGGALIMAAGGVLSLSDRRLRVGAPARRRRKPQPAAADAQPVRA
jgi:cytochrome c-type biogenesis protein CcmF